MNRCLPLAVPLGALWTFVLLGLGGASSAGAQEEGGLPAKAGDSAPPRAGPLDGAPASATRDGGPSVALDGAALPPAGVRLKAGHIMVSAAPPDLRLTEVYALDVAEPLAPPRAELALPLPAAAHQVKLLRGAEQWRLSSAGQQVELVGPLPAGQHTVALSYQLAAPEGRALVDRRFPLGADTFSVIWPEKAGFSLHAMGFADQGVVTMGPRRMRLLERRNLPPGQRTVIAVSPAAVAPQPSAPGPGQVSRNPLGQLKWLTLGLAALLFLGAMVLPRFRWFSGS